jgi:excinuclease ABC subunit A
MHNLKDIDVSFPVGAFSCVTGVSGSGKSTLVNEILYKGMAARLNRGTKLRAGDHAGIDGARHLDKVIDIDQSPIGRTPRSNPATYTGLFDHIRQLFSKTQDARARGYSPGRFSFNVKGGRCEACKGDGTITIEMHFLPDVYVPCEVCGGKRYNRETLSVRYGGRTIHEVLEMSVEEAVGAFAAVPRIHRRLQTLHDVGLDYVRLGQPATTLSGGEAQRVKLATELSKVATGRTLYVLDEPTTGLHFADIEKLLEVLQRLVDQGNTVVVIEHNLDVVKCADWVIDLGPEGGAAGGALVAAGTPEEVAASPRSHTGEYLRPILLRRATTERRGALAAAG